MGVKLLSLTTMLSAMSAITDVAHAPRPRNFYSELYKLALKVGVVPTPVEMNFGNNVFIVNNHSDSSVKILAPMLPDVHGKTISLLWYKRDTAEIAQLAGDNAELKRIVKLLELHAKKHAS